MDVEFAVVGRVIVLGTIDTNRKFIINNATHADKPGKTAVTSKSTVNSVKLWQLQHRLLSMRTTKYLYLLFHPDNFIHNSGHAGEIINTQWGQCIVDAGGYIFNTEAHPIDPEALYCCSRKQNIFPNEKAKLREFVPVNEQRKEGNNEPNIDCEEEIETSNDNGQPIEIVKLLVIRQSSLNDAKSVLCNNAVTPAPPVSESTEESTISDEEDSLSKNMTPSSDLSKVQVVASPVMYKADDSENINNFETSSTTEEHYATHSVIKNRTETLMKQSSTKIPSFDPQILLDKIRSENLYPMNVSARLNYQILSCQSQPFLQRMSIIGEFF